MNKALIKDLARKRRKFLLKKFLANTQMGIGGSIALFCSSLFIVFFILSFSATSIYPSLAATALVGAAAFLGARHCRSSSQKLKALPYVPPVAEQIAVLAPKDLLLRGSTQPTASPEELLRATHAGKVNLSDELLRPNESRTA